MRTAILLLLAATVLTGLVYPLAVTVAAGVLFPFQAHGSLIRAGGRVIGSEWIGKRFDQPEYFWPRPSATEPAGYDALWSSGSNVAPFGAEQRNLVREREARLRAADPANVLAIPADLVTASASGLDPHLSPAGARYQVARVAKARGIHPSRLQALVEAAIEPPQLGFLGESRVNVLKLNLALDNLK